MNVFVIPSWYPSVTNSITGIFFREQAVALAKEIDDIKIGISTWGQSDNRLLLWSRSPAQSLLKLASKPQSFHKSLDHNIIEYFTPTFTWTRKVVKGNIDAIVKANECNLLHFQNEFGNVDMFHAHVAYPGGYVAMKLSEKYKLPFVITEHMSPFPFSTFLDDGHLSKLVNEPLVKSSKNIAVSNALKRKMSHFGIESVVIPNLVDGDFFVPDKKSVPHEALEILSVGRLEEQKGYTYLLKAFHLLRQNHRDIKLKIIGSGELQNQLIRLTYSLDLQEAVKWEGQQTREEVQLAIQKCSFLVLASLHENLPLVLLEALASGKPVITTRCEGPEDIVDASNGYLVMPGNENELAIAMEKMIKNHQNFDAKIIRNQFEKRFSSAVVCRQIMGVYTNVIQSHKGK